MIDITQMLSINTELQDGRYRVRRYIASGGFGNTYEVIRIPDGKRLAMKEFFMRGVNLRQGCSVTVSQPDNHATFCQMKRKFFKEAIRLSSLQNDHIVRVSDYFEENQTAYYIMQLIEGESLADLMKRTGHPLSEAMVRTVLPQIADALKCVHQQGLYHLDLKPGNVMRDASDHCWLIDFGASKQLSATESRTLSTSTELCYTPGFAPSEQTEGTFKRIGPWTDLYALGATLYNLLTNQAPPSTDDITYEGQRAFRFPDNVSLDMQELVRWLMSPRYDQRPQSVDQMLLGNRQLTRPGNATVVNGATVAGKVPKGPVASVKWLWVLMAAAVLALLLWLVIPKHNRTDDDEEDNIEATVGEESAAQDGGDNSVEMAEEREMQKRQEEIDRRTRFLKSFYDEFVWENTSVWNYPMFEENITARMKRRVGTQLDPVEDSDYISQCEECNTTTGWCYDTGWFHIGYNDFDLGAQKASMSISTDDGDVFKVYLNDHGQNGIIKIWVVEDGGRYKIDYIENPEYTN